MIHWNYYRTLIIIRYILTKMKYMIITLFVCIIFIHVIISTPLITKVAAGLFEAFENNFISNLFYNLIL